MAGLALATGLFEGAGGVGSGALQRPGYLFGPALCLGGSLCYALVTPIAKQCRTVSSFALAWWPVVHGWTAMGSAWAWLAGLGVVHTGLAYVVLCAGMARLSTQRIALLQFVYLDSSPSLPLNAGHIARCA